MYGEICMRRQIIGLAILAMSMLAVYAKADGIQNPSAPVVLFNEPGDGGGGGGGGVGAGGGGGTVVAPDAYTTFVASGFFADYSVLNGTLRLDQTTGIFTSGTVTGGPGGMLFNTIAGQRCSFPVAGDCLLSLGLAGGGPNLNLVFATTSLAGFNGGAIGSVSDNAAGNYVSDIYYSADDQDQLSIGFLIPTAPTPEPSTWILCGTGLAALLVLRRRHLQPSLS